ncbi:MAG: hypothetical protein LC687_00430 [Actinobacteria bacterium]|nr:hypothetical protein [Actinomycetota bacterium]
MNNDIPVRGSTSPAENEWDKVVEDFENKHTPKSLLKEQADTSGISDVLDELEKGDASLPTIWDHPKLQGFFSFVENKIKQMHSHSRAVKDFSNVTFFELNQTLANHFDVYISLVALYNVAEVEREAEEQDFQTWWDDLYVKKRAVVNAHSLSAQKWASSKEIEAMVRVDHKDEYKDRYMGVVAARRQVQFLRRLIEGWSDFKFALQTMSKNMQTEYMNSGGEDHNATTRW